MKKAAKEALETLYNLGFSEDEVLKAYERLVDRKTRERYASRSLETGGS